MKTPTNIKKGAKDIAYLIINADDYCYSNGISRGILEAAKKGIVTATSIITTNNNFDKHIDWLKEIKTIDLGVHLCLSYGSPLSHEMAEWLSRRGWGHKFPKNKYQMAIIILSKQIRINTIAKEWEAQILKCLETGIKIRFLNSHEHFHILPPLFRLIKHLSEKYEIPFVRIPNPEWLRPVCGGALIRILLLQAFLCINKNNIYKKNPILIGISKSGKINMDYLCRRLSTLQKGQVYELMCHPGYFDPDEIRDSYLLSYHDWEGELSALSTAVIRDVYKINNIRLVRFRDLNTSNGVLKVN